MKKYTDEQLTKNYEKFIGLIKKTFSGERLEKLLFMYSENELGENLYLSPASGNIEYHNAYEGGYIDHIINVCVNSLRMMKTFEECGLQLDFTKEELIFAAMHHDLGKLGLPGVPSYVPNPSEWHVKNQGKIYIPNPELSYMTHTDRTFFTLAKYGISYNEKEYFGIKLADGMYDDDNIKYLKSYNPDVFHRFSKSPMHHIIHTADFISSRIEKQNK